MGHGQEFRDAIGAITSFHLTHVSSVYYIIMYTNYEKLLFSTYKHTVYNNCLVLVLYNIFDRIIIAIRHCVGWSIYFNRYCTFVPTYHDTIMIRVYVVSLVYIYIFFKLKPFFYHESEEIIIGFTILSR